MASTPSPRSMATGTRSPSHTSTAARLLPDRFIPAHSLDASPKASPSSSSSYLPAWRRPTLATAGSTSGRRASVQFVPTNKDPTSRSSSALPPASRKVSAAEAANA